MDLSVKIDLSHDDMKKNQQTVLYMPRVFGIALCLTLLASSMGCSRQRPSFESFTFSPDGKYLAAVYSRPGSSLIYKIALDTGKATRLTTSAEGFARTPSFSPDGKQIAFSYSPAQETRSRIVIANVDGSASMTWPASEANDLRPLFMPDGKSLVFARSGYFGNYSPIAPPTNHQWNFYVGDLDGKIFAS
jgi:dipeptidyl aminopeptidase/acylaminoacyl peptidase